MFQFRRPQANGSDPNGAEGQTTIAEIEAAQVAPGGATGGAPGGAPGGAIGAADGSFADRMLRSTLGISMADMARLGQEAQAMVAAFDRRMSAIEASVERIEALLRERLPPSGAIGRPRLPPDPE